jgi:hypothetical protein
LSRPFSSSLFVSLKSLPHPSHYPAL